MKNPQPPLVAHVIFRLDVGGLENGLVNLINAMPESQCRHVIICIDDFTDFRDRIHRNDIQVIAIHKRPGTDLLALWRMFKVFRAVKPDIVHTRNIGALDALLPAYLAGVKYRVHGEHGRDIGDLDGTNRKHRLIRKLYSPFVHRYLALSRELALYLEEQVGIPGEKVTEIVNGVDTEKFHPAHEKQALRRSLIPQFSGDMILIGYVGRLQPVKDPISLVEAFISLVRDVPDIKKRVGLVLVGDGSLRDEVEQRLVAGGCENMSWVPGSRDDVASILKCIDIFVQPSLAEGMSNTILEAMASGLPVIATDVGSNADLVMDNNCGVVIPPASTKQLADALRKYVLDPQLAQLHGRAGRARVEECFSMDGMVSKYIAVYTNHAAKKT